MSTNDPYPLDKGNEAARLDESSKNLADLATTGDELPTYPPQADYGGGWTRGFVR